MIRLLSAFRSIKTYRKVSALLAVLLLGMMWFFSGQNGEDSGRLSGRVLDLLLRLWGREVTYSTREYLAFFVRKAAHFTVFLLLGLCVRPNMKKGWHAALFCLLYAVTDEIHQHFVPGRSCEMRDVGIDAAGALCGIFLWLLFRKIKQGKKNRTLNNEC